MDNETLLSDWEFQCFDDQRRQLEKRRPEFLSLLTTEKTEKIKDVHSGVRRDQSNHHQISSELHHWRGPRPLRRGARCIHSELERDSEIG